MLLNVYLHFVFRSQIYYIKFTMKRVVVTGLGTINPLGNNVEEFWSNITAGKSAGNKVTHFDSTRFRTQVACEVKDFDPLKYLDKMRSNVVISLHNMHYTVQLRQWRMPIST